MNILCYLYISHGASGASSIGDHFLYSRDLYNYLLLLLFIIYNYFKGDIERRN